MSPRASRNKMISTQTSPKVLMIGEVAILYLHMVSLQSLLDLMKRIGDTNGFLPDEHWQLHIGPVHRLTQNREQTHLINECVYKLKLTWYLKHCVGGMRKMHQDS